MSINGRRRTSRQGSVRSQRNYYYSDGYTDDERRYVYHEEPLQLTDKEQWVEDYVYGTSRSRGSTRRPHSAMGTSKYRSRSPEMVEVGRYEKDGKIFRDYRLVQPVIKPKIVHVPVAPPKPKMRNVGVQMTTNYRVEQKKVPTRDAFTQTRVSTKSTFTQMRPRPKSPKPKPSPIVVIPPPTPPRTPTPPPPKVEEPQYIYVPKTRQKPIVIRSEQGGWMSSDKNTIKNFPLRVIEYDGQKRLKDRYMYVRSSSARERKRKTFVPLGYEMYVERPYRIPDYPR